MTEPHADAAPVASDQTGTITAIAAVGAGALLLAGCGGGGGGGASPPAPLPPALTISALTVTATPSATAVVQVANVVAPLSGSVRFALDGGGGMQSRPADPGHRTAERSYGFAITATAGAETATAECHVVINPAPERVLAGEPMLRLRHLLNRAAFGADEEALGRWLNVPYATAVARMVDEADHARTSQGAPGAAGFRPLTWQAYQQLSPADQDAYGDRKSDLIGEIYRWWLREIITTRQPLLERMALFWHNLLVVAVGDVFEPRAAWDYLDLLRRHALGNYRQLIHAIARDPAMVMFLDSNSNRKGRPNENFARELMELFTLGEGQVYTEQDVVEVAKCFTGWGLDETSALNQSFRFWQSRHEPGTKTVLGQAISHADNDSEQVRKDGEAVIERILAQNRVAVFICEKLWDEFIGGTRDSGVITTWANTFRSADYEVRPLLKAIFTHSAFTDAARRGDMIRSPVELIAAIFRPLAIEPSDYGGYHWRAGEEDQSLLNPPNVRGWIGGPAWISTRSLLERRLHMQWTGWEFHNDGRQKVPLRLDGALQTLWFATAPADTTYIAGSASVTWDPRGERIRRLLVDPALNCK